MESMTAAFRVVTAERKDIVVVTVICEECGVEISFNAETAKVPFGCPSCGKEYGENVRTALGSLGRFHRSASTAEEHAGKPMFRFSIRQAD